MKIRPFSDLHNEFISYRFKELDTDPEDVLILAGDIATAADATTWRSIREQYAANRFRKIIHICGNHEHYGSSWLKTHNTIRNEIFIDMPGIYVAVDNEVVRVDDVSFVCATLWTSFNRGSPIIMDIARRSMNDYYKIRTGSSLDKAHERKLHPQDTLNQFITSEAFVHNAIVQEKAAGQKVCVVTHHAPSELSCSMKYKGSALNYAYCSDLEELILNTKPDLWIHGHVHNSNDYMIGTTRIVTNPRGYAGHNFRGEIINENTEFNDILRLDI